MAEAARIEDNHHAADLRHLVLRQSQGLLHLCRHSYATDFLADGKSIKVLAELMGTSVTMLEKHYAHLQVKKAKMLSMVREFAAGRHQSAVEEPKA